LTAEKQWPINILGVKQDVTCYEEKWEEEWSIVALRAKGEFKNESALEVDKDILIIGHSRQSED
jgi:hypothetical protein